MFPLTCNAIGDIVTLASLVFDIIRALNETRGSAADYRVLAGELDAMHTMLTAVARIAQDTANESLRYEILKEVDRCGQDVQNALARIIKFSALGHAGAQVHSPRVYLARQWYKLEWRFIQRGAIQTVRAELQTATQRLTALLVISNADGAARFRISLSVHFRALAERDAAHFRSIGRITEMLREVKVATTQRDRAFVEELFTRAPSGVDSKTVAVAVLCVAVCAVHATDRTLQTALLVVIYILLRPAMQKGRSLVHDVSYTEHNAVTLFDALGRRIVLPVELCGSYDLLHATLISLFSRTNGQWFVETHAYDIMDLRTATVASPNEWSTVVRIGARIEMSVIVQQVGSDRELIQCPCCQGPAFENKNRAGMLCKNCVRTFEVTTRGRPSSDVDIISNITCDSDECYDHESVNDCGFMYTGARLEEPGVQPYVGHLWGLMSGEPTSAQDGRLVVHSGPWRARIQEFKRIRILYDTFIPHVALRNRHNDLHLAAGNGHLALVAELLDQGADVDTRDRLGHTALHYAAHRVQVHVMLLLLDRGAAIDAMPAVNYLTPLACVVWRRHRAAARLLLALGAIVAAPQIAKLAVFYAAASVGDVGTAEVMIRLGVDVNSIDDMGKTALHRAAGGNNSKMVEVLLRYGANVNTRSWRGNTPLSLASKGGYVDVMKTLLAAGADPDTGQPGFPNVMHEM